MNNPATPMPRLLGKPEVLQTLLISDRTLEKLVRARKFPQPLRLGKTVRWDAAEVVRWLNVQLEAQRAWEPPKRAIRPAARA